MKLLFSHKGKYARIADKDRMIFAVDDTYYDVTGTQVPEEPGFRSNASAWDSDDDDPWARVTAAEQGLDEPLLSESVEEIVWEIDDGFGKFGFKNRNGEFVIEPQYAYAHEFTCGLACVNLNRTWYHTPEGRRYYENHYDTSITEVKP